MSDVDQKAHIRGSGNLVIQAGRDVNFAAEPKLHLTRYETRRGRIESDADRLTAYARAIDMIGRETEMASLSDWMGSAPPIAVRVLTGPAGTGKTRLALELVDQAIEHEWDAGFVTDRELGRFAAQANLAAWGWQNPTLIVVDYAAARAQQLGNWLAELADNDTVTPLRLLLLERHADPGSGWWREAFGLGSGDARAILKLLDPAEPVPVPALGDTEVRRAILAAILAQVGSGLRPPERGANPDFDGRLARVSWGGEPLFLQMAGVLAAESGFEHVLTLSRAKLAFTLADREISRIEKIATAHAMGSTKDFVVHMAAYATLCQGLTRGEALPAIAAEKTALMRASAGDPSEVFRALASTLPGEADAIAPVLPDMIGEAVLLRAGIDADAIVRAAASHRPRVAATVMRTAQDYVPQEQLAPLDWLDRLIEAGGVDLAALTEIANALPSKTLVLRTRAAELHAKIVEMVKAMPDDGPTGQRCQILAPALNNLAARLSEVGRPEEALGIAGDAVSLYRDLAAANSDAFNSNLAASLNTLANRLSEVGKREKALDIARESVELRRDLAAANPDAFTPNLAISLNNLANRLGEAGKRKEALDIARETVELRRALAAANPDAFTPNLATSLSNLAAMPREAGKREEALDVAREAVELRRALAAANPDAFTVDLVRSLGAMHQCQSALDRNDEALATIAEALEKLTPHFRALPAAHGPLMAQIVRGYLELAETLGREPDAKLVAPVAEIFASLESQDDDDTNGE